MKFSVAVRDGCHINVLILADDATSYGVSLAVISFGVILQVPFITVLAELIRSV